MKRSQQNVQRPNKLMRMRDKDSTM